jgi:hypothetical protein
VTMLVGFHLDKYVLIGADTRMTREMKDGTFTFEDGHEKVRETRLGLAAGAGSVALIRPVMDRLSGDECAEAGYAAPVVMPPTKRRPAPRSRRTAGRPRSPSIRASA